jgi:hypothetical protein
MTKTRVPSCSGIPHDYDQADQEISLPITA